jgi:alpha-N-arabinofuranosidase
MHPDPTICRVGRDLYVACSSFEYFPGAPIYHTRDLVSWRPIGSALTRASQLDLRGVPSSGGIYAPTLRHHDGTFFLVTTLVGRGHFVVTARHPRGPWSEPIWLDADGIDPSLAFLDGRVFYTRNGPGTDQDHPFVYQSELGSDLALLRKPRVIWRGTGGIWPEGPHLYRRGGWYYLVTAEGGTSYGHSVVVARSRTPHGPFAESPHGPLLTHRDRPRHPVQAVGHADIVELEDGRTWAVLLGIRPTGRHHHLGRETFLTQVDWDEDGWPRARPLELHPPRPARERLEFRARRLAPGWVFVRNPVRGSWSLRERPSWLRLWGAAAGLADVASPSLLCRRQQHLELTARTLLEFDPRHANEQAGICIRQNEQFHVALLVALGANGRELRLERTIAGRTATIGRARLGSGRVMLEIEASRHAYSFRGGTGGRRHELGRVSTQSLSAETIHARTGRHHFTGATIALYATGSGTKATVPADFAWLELGP